MTQSKARPGSNLTDFYREEFLKHRRCLRAAARVLLRQRHYIGRSRPHPHHFPTRTSLSQGKRRPGRQRPAAEVQRRHGPVGLDRSEERSLRFAPVAFSPAFSDHCARRHRGRVSASSDRARRAGSARSPRAATAGPARDCRRQGRAVHGGRVRGDGRRSHSRRHRHRHASADCAAGAARMDSVEPSAAGCAQRRGGPARARGRAAHRSRATRWSCCSRAARRR